jgi:streptogramin lyase
VIAAILAGVAVGAALLPWCAPPAAAAVISATAGPPVGTMIIDTIAGSGHPDYKGIDVPDPSVLQHATSIFVEPSGQLLVAAREANQIVRVDPATGSITVVAGTGAAEHTGDGDLATDAGVEDPRGAATDANGDIWLIEANSLRKIDHTTLTISTVLASSASVRLYNLRSLLVTSAGDIYLSDAGSFTIGGLEDYTQVFGARVLKRTAAGVVTRVAGRDENTPVSSGFMPSPYPTSPVCLKAITPELCGPQAVTIGADGRLRVLDGGWFGDGAIKKISSDQFAYRLVSVPAGGDASMVGDGAGGFLTISSYDDRVLHVDAGLAVATIAGTGTAGYNGDQRTAATAQLNRPRAVARDGQGRVLIADAGNGRVRRLDDAVPRATLTGRVVGTESLGGVQVELYQTFPLWDRLARVAVDPTGEFRFDDIVPGRYRVRVVDPFDRYRTTWVTDQLTQRAGEALALGPGQTVDRSIALVEKPPGAIEGIVTAGIDHLPKANVWVQAMLPSGFVAGGRSGPDGRFRISGLASRGYRLRIVDLDGTYPRAWYQDALGYATSTVVPVFNTTVTINPHLGPADAADVLLVSTVAGTGIEGTTGDGLLGVNAKVNTPHGVAVDANGNVYFSEKGQVVRRVDRLTGIITRVAGTGVGGYNGDGIDAKTAQLYNPNGLAVDGAGNVFIADLGNGRVRRVDAVTGKISTVAGGGSVPTRPAAAADAAFFLLSDVELAPDGGILIASDSTQSGVDGTVDRLDPASGMVDRLAGGSIRQPRGPALETYLGSAPGIALGADGELYIVGGRFDSVIWRLDPETNEVSVYAGVYGHDGFNGDWQPANQALLDGASRVAVDADGNLFIADTYNYRVRRVEKASGIITTIAGTGVPGFDPTILEADKTRFVRPDGIATFQDEIIVADEGDNRVRRIKPGP